VKRVGLVGAAVTIAIATFMPSAPAAAAGTWLDAVNAYRASAALPPVTENGTFSGGDLQHSQYLVENDAYGHDESPTLPYYTPTGAAAGQASNVMTSGSTSTTDSDAVDVWMSGPFHSVGIVDPYLSTVGFGSFRLAKPGEQMAASLNVIGGRTQAPAGTSLPVLWPGNGASISLLAYTGGESPDPLTSCPGYSVPAGLPILLETGTTAAAVTGYSLSAGGQPLQVCEFDGTNYANSDANAQADGRAVLAPRGAVTLIPRRPLSPGVTYQVSVTVNGSTYSWSFSGKASGAPTAATAVTSQRQASAPRPRTAVATTTAKPVTRRRPAAAAAALSPSPSSAAVPPPDTTGIAPPDAFADIGTVAAQAGPGTRTGGLPALIIVVLAVVAAAGLAWLLARRRRQAER